MASVERCARAETFIRSFYDRFLAASPDVQAKFRHTDFERQERMLLRSLRLVAGATAGDAESLQELRERAETHDRDHLDIEPRLYELWQSALIETAAEFDPEWSPSVEAAWQRILHHAVQHMIRHY